jgi:SWI/SNF-related matrix-associated actin-dependent regulator of chromatin subfamily D
MASTPTPSTLRATPMPPIQGRMLDEAGDEGLEEEEEDEKDADAMDEDDQESKPAAKAKPFTHYFTSITIDFDRAKSLQPDNFTQIEWKKSETPGAKDYSEIEFERKGDENINVTINLQRYQNPEVCKSRKFVLLSI